jgi:hypothetical protein
MAWNNRYCASEHCCVVNPIANSAPKPGMLALYCIDFHFESTLIFGKRVFISDYPTAARVG